MAKNNSKNEKKRFTDDDVFTELGIGTETANLPLRKLISGQRKINGRLYRSIELILDHLKALQNRGKIETQADKDKRAAALETADEINREIPGKVPPYCDDEGLGP